MDSNNMTLGIISHILMMICPHYKILQLILHKMMKNKMILMINLLHLLPTQLRVGALH